MKWSLHASVLAIAFLALLVSRDFLARVAWQNYHWPTVAMFLDRGDAALAMQVGNYYFGGGMYDLAVAGNAYRRAVSIDPKILWGHYQLARILFIGGDFERALEEIGLELSANPNNLRALYVRGLIYGYTGNLPEAESDFRVFTQWAPLEWAGYNDLAWILEKEKKYAEAEQAIEDAFKKVPMARENPWLWNSIGVALLNQDKKDGAKASFEQAKRYAATLTEDEWRRSYPGNAPSQSAAGLESFRDAVEENLKRSE